MYRRTASDTATILEGTATIMKDMKMVTHRQEMEAQNMKMQEGCFKQQMDKVNSEITNIYLQIEALTVLLQNISEKIDSVNLGLQHVVPQDCKHSDKSGMARIFPPQSWPNQLTPITVFCDQTSAGGGWLVFFRIIDDTEDFPNRLWQQYKDGFGDVKGTFWLGLEALHQLTARPATLRISLEDWDGNTKYVQYTQFSISGEEDGYRLSCGAYSGDAGDNLAYHCGAKFSTIDKDQDDNNNVHCVEEHSGAWWYQTCPWSYISRLTGRYYASSTRSGYGRGTLWWNHEGGSPNYMKAEMMLRH